MNNGWQHLNPDSVRITKAATPPANPSDGDLHYESGATDLNYIFRYDSIRNAWLSLATKYCTFFINGTVAFAGGPFYMQMNGMGTLTAWGATEEAGYCHVNKDHMIIGWMFNQQNATVGNYTIKLLNQVHDNAVGEVTLAAITQAAPGSATEKDVNDAALLVQVAGGKGFIRVRVDDSGSAGNTLIYPVLNIVSKFYLAPT